MHRLPPRTPTFTWDHSQYSSLLDVPEYKQSYKEWDNFYKSQGVPRADRRRLHAAARKTMLQHARLVKRPIGG